MRKPVGGGPAGVAARGLLVEKRTAVAGVEVFIRDAARRDVAVGRLRASTVRGLAVAIMCTLVVGWARFGGGGSLVMLGCRCG